MSRYTSATDADRRGDARRHRRGLVEELFADIPANVRFARRLDLPAGLSETEVFDHLRELAAKNVSADDEVSFLGAGMYDHYVPGLVEHVIERSEFLTPYTPYQPEISQGNLQAMFEYQTAICELTALPVSNASVYEAPSAVGAAGYLAKLTNGRPRFLVSPRRAPARPRDARDDVRRLRHERRRGPARRRRHRPRRAGPALDSDVAAVVLQQPNFLGARRGRRGAGRRGQGARRDRDLPVRRADARRAQAARRVRRRPRRRRGPAARQPPRLRRPVVRLLRRHGRTTCARCRAGSPGRRPTSTAAAAGSSRCRPASSTSAARRRRRTSAPPRR